MADPPHHHPSNIWEGTMRALVPMFEKARGYRFFFG